ncbi:MAG: M28 family metallopeptidase [Comamonadaceae bacterium]|nr:M28 family metallopeptidase [Comamonadaceae bacterium]
MAQFGVAVGEGRGRPVARRRRRAPSAWSPANPTPGIDRRVRGGPRRRPRVGVRLARRRAACAARGPIPVFAVSPKETAPLRENVAAGEQGARRIRARREVGQRRGPTRWSRRCPGRDRSKYILFCAHGDSDSGGPGANDNASGVAIVLEIARTAGGRRQVRARSRSRRGTCASRRGEARSPRPASTWPRWRRTPRSCRRSSTTTSRASASSKDALYVEPDDVPANKEIITLVRSVMTDHLGDAGVPGARRQREDAGRHRLLRLPAADAGRDGVPVGHALHVGLGQGARAAGDRGVPAASTGTRASSPGW